MRNIIENESLKLIINSFGAELNSIKKDGIEYLWQADPAFWARRAPVLFPIVGKLKNGSYHLGEDKELYKMGGHGFARDQDFTIIKDEEDELVYELVPSRPTLDQYPFFFFFHIGYKLIGNKIQVSYSVENDDETAYKFGLGAHPAFNVPIAQGTFEDYSLSISPAEKRTFIPLDPPSGMMSLDNKKEVEVSELALNRELFKEDALIYSSSPEMDILLSSPLDERSVRVTWKDMPFFGLWSPYPAEAPFVCIEPWCGITDDEKTDGDLTKKFGMNEIKPGETFSCQYTIEIN